MACVCAIGGQANMPVRFSSHIIIMLCYVMCSYNDFRLGIIRPLLKCKHGDQTCLDMYRGITLNPVLSKLFEAVLLLVVF